MKKLRQYSVDILTTFAIVLLSVFGYIQFGLLNLIFLFLIIIILVVAIWKSNIIILKVTNVIFSLVLTVQAFTVNSSNLVSSNQACLDICIGENLPFFLLKGFSVIVLLLASSILIRQFVEKK